jgi:uncharacterized protein YkwD
MYWALIASLALLLKSGASPAKATPQVASAPAMTGTYQPSPGEDPEAEGQLLDLANEARKDAGAPPLEMDVGLTDAARTHDVQMVSQQQLSHQFSGEPSLVQRIAETTTLHLDRAGENVAVAESVEGIHSVLMHSPPHRENLLNPGYNVAGFAVLRSGSRLYVVQDFGHELPKVAPASADEQIAKGVDRIRQQDRVPLLTRADGSMAESIACAMAKADSLNTPAPNAYYLLRYTTMQPEKLPADAERIVGNRALRSFSVGSCYAKTPSYPNGAYWVALLFD